MAIVPNIDPIYTLTGDISTGNNTTMPIAIGTTGSNSYDGTSAQVTLLFTASANGSYIRKLRFKAIGTNIASLARIWINNGSTNGSATNNEFYGEVSLPATTAMDTTATLEIDYPMELALNPSFRLYWVIATTVAAGWICVAEGGQY